jgi:hydrophobe/amphiphile efflux-1 (HAE1) family protein
VRISIEEVVKTLAEAIVLVFLVMYLFLQNFRATLIPTIAVPVVLLGTFGVLAAAGYSINTLTMFGMVLAIGLLVDDAIVVVENVERVMQEERLSPRDATRKSMDQITGALIGIALVLATVFIPMAFFGGSVGMIYRQFSITIVAAMALSVLVAVILTPALCATLLKPGHGLTRKGPFGLFNRGYEASARGYQRFVGLLTRWRWPAMLVFVALSVGRRPPLRPHAHRLPPRRGPGRDQRPGAAPARQHHGAHPRRARQGRHLLHRHEEAAVETAMTISGFGFQGRGQNSGIAFIRLRPWDEREGDDLRAAAVAGRAMAAFSQIKEATIFAVVPPAISELGNASGFQLQLQDRGGLGHEALIAARDQLLGLASKEPSLVRVRQGGLEDTPQYKIDVDREKAAALGLSLADINATLAATWGGSYVNDFIDRGRTKRVYLQGDAPFRMQPDDIDRWYVRNGPAPWSPSPPSRPAAGPTAPPSSTASAASPRSSFKARPPPASSSGDAMATMERLMATQMPAGIGHEWSGLSYEERLAGAGALSLYAVSLLVVFLCLAALYESWSIPVSVMLVVPLGVAGAVVTTLVFGLANDVYFQVGLLTTIGLSSKNAILIVEFARELRMQGKDRFEAALQAARTRLRPILMTSLAFILGVLPLALSSGAGAGAQNAIGIAVIGGVVAGTVLGVLLVPVFYVVVAYKDPRPLAAPAPTTT